MQERKRFKWIHILAKGVITLPKKFRDKVGIKDGDVVKGYVEKGKIILEPEHTKDGEKVEKVDKVETVDDTHVGEEWVTFEKKS